jgi:pimeloyl-ACP methyl ester carboxylesterase
MRESGGGAQPAAYVSRFIEVRGLRLHYLDYGTAGRTPMLCLHGGAAHAHWFDFVAPAFTADYHVISLDQRGHGDSAWAHPPDYSYESFAADLAEAVDKLGLRDFVLVGHSMGGMIALVYAATYPGRVARLVVIDSTLRMTEERVASLRTIGTRRGSSYATREEFLQRFRLRPSGTTATAEIVAHLAEHSARRLEDGGWAHKFDRDVYARRQPLDGAKYWGRIGIPALLIKGELSRRITPEIIADVKANCPQVELAEVSHSEHHVPLDNPGGFVRAVRLFLDG